MEDPTEGVWTTELEQIKADASDQFDAEYIEHDAALNVFKSPRPSYTLDEQSKHVLQECLLQEQRQRRTNMSSDEESHEASTWEDPDLDVNPWEPQQRGGGISVEDEFGEGSHDGTDGDSQPKHDSRRGPDMFNPILIETSSEEDEEWQEVGDDFEEDGKLSGPTPSNMLVISSIMGEEQNVWAETC